MLGYRLAAIPGVLLGIVLILIGTSALLLSYSVLDPMPPYLVEIAAILGFPVWIGWTLLLAGFLTYIWAQGILGRADWSPLFVSVYLFHLGLYVTLLLFLVYAGRIPFIDLQFLVIEVGGIPDNALQGIVVLAPAVIGFGLARLLARSPAVIAVYENKYSTLKWPLRTCPKCRRVLDQNEKVCRRCNAQEYRAYLILVDDESERHTLAVSPGNERVRLKRYEPGEDLEAQTIYFNPTRYSVYGTISSPHADVVYDGAQGAFTLMDLTSSNGSYVNGMKVDPKGGPIRLQNGDEVHLGEARFRFEIASGVVTNVPKP